MTLVAVELSIVCIRCSVPFRSAGMPRPGSGGPGQAMAGAVAARCPASQFDRRGSARSGAHLDWMSTGGVRSPPAQEWSSWLDTTSIPARTWSATPDADVSPDRTSTEAVNGEAPWDPRSIAPPLERRAERRPAMVRIVEEQSSRRPVSSGSAAPPASKSEGRASPASNRASRDERDWQRLCGC